MLNKELLKYRINSRRVSVGFIDQSPEMLQLAEILLSIYREAQCKNTVRGVLEENLEPLIKNSSGGKIASGMNKLIADHCEFISAAGEGDAAQLREVIFRKAAAFLHDPPADPARFRAMVQAECKLLLPVFPEDIYCDLPEFDRLKQVPAWSPADLINVYNIALVQGLLFYADTIEISVADSEPMTLRKFMRRLKFYRLLAEVKRASASEIRLNLSGPAAVFGENRKYGLQLAAFFPVILLLKKWKLRAELKLRDGENCVLNLDSNKCALKSPLQRWAAYVPEEVTLFIKAFRTEVPEWNEAFDADLPKIANVGTIFPDFSFEHVETPGKVVHLELFHRANNYALEERLSFLEREKTYPLVIGIDRSALGKNGEQELLKKYPALPEHAFFFSNYPGVERVKKMLNKVLEYNTAVN